MVASHRHTSRRAVLAAAAVSGPTQLEDPQPLAVDANYLYVFDDTNDLLMKYRLPATH
jgi:hypothetical protein